MEPTRPTPRHMSVTQLHMHNTSLPSTSSIPRPEQHITSSKSIKATTVLSPFVKDVSFAQNYAMIFSNPESSLPESQTDRTTLVNKRVAHLKLNDLNTLHKNRLALASGYFTDRAEFLTGLPEDFTALKSSHLEDMVRLYYDLVHADLPTQIKTERTWKHAVHDLLASTYLLSGFAHYFPDSAAKDERTQVNEALVVRNSLDTANMDTHDCNRLLSWLARHSQIQKDEVLIMGSQLLIAKEVMTYNSMKMIVLQDNSSNERFIVCSGPNPESNPLKYHDTTTQYDAHSAFELIEIPEDWTTGSNIFIGSDWGGVVASRMATRFMGKHPTSEAAITLFTRDAPYLTEEECDEFNAAVDGLPVGKTVTVKHHQDKASHGTGWGYGLAGAGSNSLALDITLTTIKDGKGTLIQSGADKLTTLLNAEAAYYKRKSTEAPQRFHHFRTCALERNITDKLQALETDGLILETNLLRAIKRAAKDSDPGTSLKTILTTESFYADNPDFNSLRSRLDSNPETTYQSWIKILDSVDMVDFCKIMIPLIEAQAEVDTESTPLPSTDYNPKQAKKDLLKAYNNQASGLNALMRDRAYLQKRLRGSTGVPSFNPSDTHESVRLTRAAIRDLYLASLSVPTAE